MNIHAPDTKLANSAEEYSVHSQSKPLNLAKYTHMCVDLDGTLTETDPGMYHAVETALDAFGLSLENLDAKVESFLALNVRYWDHCDRGAVFTHEMRYRQMADFLEILGEQVEDIVAFSKVFSAGFATGAPFYPGAVNFLQAASAQWPLAIVTNGFATVQHSRMKFLGLEKYISHLIISEEVGYAKPLPQIFDAAFEAMGGLQGSSRGSASQHNGSQGGASQQAATPNPGTPQKEVAPNPAEVIMIGDSLTADIAGGNNYGMDTCWVAYGKDPAIGYDAGATYVVDTLAELTAAFASTKSADADRSALAAPQRGTL